MAKFILDSNVFDQLEKRPELKERPHALVADGLITVLVPPTIKRELDQSPFQGVPTWFPVELTSDSVTILDYAQLRTSSLGIGDVYKTHKGISGILRDAVIADAANTDADIFVSEDGRCRKRLAQSSSSCKSMDFNEFEAGIVNL